MRVDQDRAGAERWRGRGDAAQAIRFVKVLLLQCCTDRKRRDPVQGKAALMSCCMALEWTGPYRETSGLEDKTSSGRGSDG